MSLAFNVLFTDEFTPDANPLNPANWTTMTDFADLQAVSGFCEASVLADVNICGAVYTGSPINGDQFVTATITADQTVLGGELEMTVRTDITFTDGASFNIIPTGTGNSSWSLVTGIVLATGTTVVAPGDVFTLACVGKTFYVFQNGVSLAVGTDNSATLSNLPSITIEVANSLSDIKLTDFTTGTVTSVYSVPDCRNYGTFPNSSRDVNGTLIYDVQTSSNSAVPGTDSRAAGAPVDCRVSPNIPLNSRTPGTFGPGE